jgi:hypothetical protein
MKTDAQVSLWFLLAVAAVSGLLGAGCEVDSAAARPKIDPSYAVVHEGESVALTASGGYEYEWSLSSPSWGILSSRTGNPIVYTSTFEPASNATEVIQTVRVRSWIPGSGASGGSSNAPGGSSGYQQTAEAQIRHM